MIRLYIIALASILFIKANAQNLSANEVQQMINNKHFTFKAQRVTPQTGASRQLTTEYFLKIANDTLTSALPYFGRAYTAPIDPSDAGYDFTTNKFDYSVSAKKKIVISFP